MQHLNNKILFIDDDPDSLSIYADVLEEKGFIVYAAYNKTVGLKSALNNKPDLVILDVMMCTQDEEIDLVHKLRTLPQFEKTQIIMLTSFSPKKNFNRQFKNNDYCQSVPVLLDKYVSPEELAKHAKRYLN